MKFDLKATMYDIFGYLFPGIIVTYWMLYELKMSKIINFENMDMKILSDKTDETILFLIIAYFAGHFVSVVAEILFENITYDSIIKK